MFLKDSKKTNKKTQDLELGINELTATATAETQTEFHLESKLEESKIDSKNKIIQKNVVDKGTQYNSQLNDTKKVQFDDNNDSESLKLDIIPEEENQKQEEDPKHTTLVTVTETSKESFQK